MNPDGQRLLYRIRILIAVVIAGLVVSGVTAFPLVHEIDLLYAWLNTPATPGPVLEWISQVRRALHFVDANYPFLAYGTDWLAFGHLVIALFFFGPLIDPVRNAWVIRAGQIACVAVIPLALICGELRGIPVWWRAIDCAFGVAGFIPLWFAERAVRKLATVNQLAPNEWTLK